jgi:hypothetical protein
MKRRLALCASLLALVPALFVTPAHAAESPSHPFVGELTGKEEPRHPPTGAFEDACGVALDSAGDRYVADYYHDAIDVFDLAHEYLTQIAAESAGNGPCGLAVDSTGRLYVDNWRQDVVRFTPSSYPPSESTTYGPGIVIDASGLSTGVAVDPATGNVYVDDGTYVAEYEASGALVAKIGLGSLEEGYGLAVSSFPATAGDLYVPDAASGTVRVFGPAGETLPAIDGAGTPQAGFAYLVDSNVAVDNNPALPSYGHVYVLDNVEHGLSEHPAAVVDEFNPAGSYRGQIARWVSHPEPGVTIQHSIGDAEPSGLAIGSGGDVYVTSGNSEEAVLDIFGPTAPAETLAVAKSGAGVGTVSSEPAGIACGTACTAEYDEGAQVTLTAIPDPHSAFSGWSGGGCSGTGTCKVTMSETKAVSAEFEALPQQTLTVAKTGSGEGSVASVPAGISCPGTCSEHFNEGSTVLLLAAPAPHNKLVSWAGQCIPAEYPNYPNECAVQMSEAKSIEAEFAPIPQQNLEVSVSGAGTVASVPAGISCPGTCSEHFDEASTVTLTASPAIHNEVAWSGCSAEPSPTQCEVTMGEARSVSATFSPILHSLAVSVVGGGSVSADHGALSGCSAGAGSCSGPYEEGEAVTLNASPAAGWTFAGFSGGCGGTGPCHLTIEADTAVTANFAALPPPPIIASLTLGALTVKGATAALKISVSGPGAVLAAGSGLKRASAAAGAAGPLTLPLALSGPGKRALARSKHHKLAVKVTLTFTPSDGGVPAIVTKTVTFRAANGRHSKHHSKRRRH